MGSVAVLLGLMFAMACNGSSSFENTVLIVAAWDFC